MRLLLSVTIISFLLTFNVFAFDRSSIKEDASEVTPLLNGMQVPNITVKTADGDPLSLLALLMQKPSVIVFYRGGWCPYCSRQLAELKNIEDELVDAGYQIIAISPESAEKLQSQKLKTEFAAQLISDEQLNAIKAFGIAFYVENKTRQIYKNKMDVTLPEDQTKRAVLPAPAIFITDTQGQILFNYVNPNFRVRPSAELILNVAKMVLE